MGTVRCLFLVLSALSAVESAAQNPTVRPDSIKDPRALLSAVAPFYDFANPALKPWHMRASYHIYDPSGQLEGDGTYEHWWVSPTVYRSTWTRGGSSHSEWHTADGRKFQKDDGEALHLFEIDFPGRWLSPFPGEEEIDSNENHLTREMISAGKVKVPCVDVGITTGNSLGYEVGSRYCFDPANAILIAQTSRNGISVTYGNFAQVQGRQLSRSLVERVNERSLLTASVDAVTGLDPTDPALKPPVDAKPDDAGWHGVSDKVMQGRRTSGPNPEYPEKAKAVRLTGSVIIEAVIGKDGRIHNLQVVSSPGPLLSDAASRAVSQWDYKPYLLNGEPVEVRTTIAVNYAMSF